MRNIKSFFRRFNEVVSSNIDVVFSCSFDEKKALVMGKATEYKIVMREYKRLVEKKEELKKSRLTAREIKEVENEIGELLISDIVIDFTYALAEVHKYDIRAYYAFIERVVDGKQIYDICPSEKIGCKKSKCYELINEAVNIIYNFYIDKNENARAK